jgi:hypothetical protein
MILKKLDKKLVFAKQNTGLSQKCGSPVFNLKEHRLRSLKGAGIPLRREKI